MPTSIPETESAVQASTSSSSAAYKYKYDEKNGKKKEKDATLFSGFGSTLPSHLKFLSPRRTGLVWSGCPWSGTCLEVTYWWKLGGEPAVFGCLVASQS